MILSSLSKGMNFAPGVAEVSSGYVGYSVFFSRAGCYSVGLCFFRMLLCWSMSCRVVPCRAPCCCLLSLCSPPLVHCSFVGQPEICVEGYLAKKSRLLDLVAAARGVRRLKSPRWRRKGSRRCSGSCVSSKCLLLVLPTLFRFPPSPPPLPPLIHFCTVPILL